MNLMTCALLKGTRQRSWKMMEFKKEIKDRKMLK